MFYLVYRQFRTLNFGGSVTQQTRGWQYRAYSAGSTPWVRLIRTRLSISNRWGLIPHLLAPRLKEFTVEGSTSIDIVITVCDSAAVKFALFFLVAP